MIYTKLAEFPEQLRERIKQLYGFGKAEEWMKSPVPALDGKSILETMNGWDGETKVEEHIGKVEGYLGG